MIGSLSVMMYVFGGFISPPEHPEKTDELKYKIEETHGNKAGCRCKCY